MRAVFLCGVVLLLSCRDLSVPQSQDGRVSGVVMVSEASGALSPVARATAQVVGTGIRTTSNEAGVFQLSPITSPAGQVVVSFDADGDGVSELQRSFDFATWGIGPARQTSLGTIVLRENAIVSGQVLLQGSTGLDLAGSDVFVPGLPTTARTADDGSFVLTGVPEGGVSLVATHDGYAPRRINGVVARSAERLTLAPIVLTPIAAGATGSVVGRVTFQPSAPGVTPSLVLLAGSGAATSGIVAGDGTFRVEQAVGRVTLVLSAAGYSDAVLRNVVIAPGEVTDLGLIVMNAGELRFDAGQVADAGRIAFGCGDGVFQVGEACDDGNARAGDGCSDQCALEVQGKGGERCLDAMLLRLSPTSPDSVAGRAAGSGAPSNDFSTECLGVVREDVTWRFTVPFAARVSVTAASGAVPDVVSIRPAAACATLELGCGRAFTAAQTLAAGDYVAVVFLADPTKPWSLDVTAVREAVSSTCGNGSIEPGEVCDDGNASWTDGCSPACELANQGPGGESCADATRLTLVPVSANTRSAIARGPSSALPDLPSMCGAGPDVTYRVTLPVTSTLTVSGSNGPASPQPHVSIATPSCTQELFCRGMGLESPALPPGDYVVALFVDGLTPYQISVAARAVAVPAGCANGTVEPGEECDDGNEQVFDGCSAVCTLEAQSAEPSCPAAPLVKLSPIGGGARGASLVAGLLPSMAVANTCAPSFSQGAYRLVLTQSALVTVLSQDSANDVSISVHDAPNCAVARELQCVNANGGGGAEMLTLSLDAGTYLVVLGGAQQTYASGQLVVR